MIRWKGTFRQWQIIKAMVILSDTSLTDFFRQSVEVAHRDALEQAGYFDAERGSQMEQSAKSA